MWKSMGLLVVAGGAVYHYAVEPAWVNWGLPGECSRSGGVLLKADAKEAQYVSKMNELAENKARLESGEGRGCLPEAKCAMSLSEAVAMMDRKIVSWDVTDRYYTQKLRALNKLHDGKGIDLPGDGLASRVSALARIEEARFCSTYLQKSRTTLANWLEKQQPSPTTVRN